MNASPPGGEVEDPLERGGKGADTTESCDPTKIQDAYALCTETILTCLDARLAIITQPPTVQQDVVVALCQQVRFRSFAKGRPTSSFFPCDL